jgi:hypothetical protein
LRWRVRFSRVIIASSRDNGKRFIVRADEKLTAFLELELAVGPYANCLDKLA